MGIRIGERSDSTNTKSQLVISICNISNRATTCAQRHRRRLRNNSVASPFIDWYLLLQVEENVEVDVIRKQYHKLALLLHPDKNKHPKAEIAFKLVYEAYACLSDGTKRAEFDSERRINFCKECNKLSHMTCNSPVKTTTKLRGLFTRGTLRTNNILHVKNDIKAKFKEETRVLEKCLKVNAATQRESQPFSSLGKEVPIFNPSDYLRQGYPHYRTWNFVEPDSFGCLQRKGKYNSPIFESRTERRPDSFWCFQRTEKYNFPIFESRSERKKPLKNENVYQH